MNQAEKLQKTLEEHKKAIIDDDQLDAEEEERRRKNKELQDRFNAINDSLKFDESLLKPSAYELKIKSEKESGASNKLDNLESEFQSVFAKMGELLFNSGLMNQIEQNQVEEGDNEEKDPKNKESDEEEEQNKTEECKQQTEHKEAQKEDSN